jgi:NTE family protein
VAFVLSGGGVLGAVQVGQLRALIEAGIEPDLLVATSVGALNAAAIAADPSISGVDLLTDVWSSLRGEDLFPGTRVQRALHFVRKGDHLYSNDGIRALVRKLSVRSFEEMQRPLSIVTANLRSGAEHVFEAGPIAPPLIATTALPGIFPPVLIEGELYVDGGVVNNVPISVAVEHGARKIYVLTCGAPKPTTTEIRRPLDVLLQAFAHSRAARVDVDLRRFADVADIRFVTPPAPPAIRFNDTSHTARLMAEGYELAREYLGQSDRAAARA